MTTLTYAAVARQDAPVRDRSGGPSTIRLCVEAIRDGLAAAHRYQQLQARGVPRAEAAARAINENS